MKKVIVELKVAPGRAVQAVMGMDAVGLPGFQLDEGYEPVPIEPAEEAVTAMAGGEETVLVRGEVDEEKEEELRSAPNVVEVWTDARVEHFTCEGCGETGYKEATELSDLEDLSELAELLETGGITPQAGEAVGTSVLAATPCTPVDCASSVPKGTIADVARYLRCDRLWAKGIRGQGVVIGICDTGVDKNKVPGVIGGWSPNPSYPPGTDPGGHGSMTATDALGMAPAAQIYDIGILKSSGGISGLLSDAITAYQWALDQYKKDKTPQILSNSWGMFRKNWAPDYATNPNHPFTRKVVQVINTGILVTFAAGNCGQVCPSGRCSWPTTPPSPPDIGPGKSIWGANGHPRVITVGAANIREEWIGYTSQGPAALDPNKPDFCAPSHFKGYYNSDTGTSAACPVCAGVLALYRSHDPNLKQDDAKAALQETAKNLCASGWDPHSGYGMIQAEAAFNKLFFFETPLIHANWVHGNSVEPEWPDRLLRSRPMGPYGLFYGKPNSFNWFHFAIPTPVIVNNRRLRLDSVMLMFITSPDTWVTNVHIWDGHIRLENYDGLSMTGVHWFERFDILNRYARYGITACVGVRFGGENRSHYAAFISGGGDFIR